MKMSSELQAKLKSLGLTPTGPHSFDIVLEGVKCGIPAEGLSKAVQSFSQSAVSLSEDELRAYLQPQDEDYVRVPTRALSATSVQNNLINFGHNNGAALMAAVSLFNGLTVLKDHMFTVDNWLGKTEGAYWDTETPNVPPGVNLVMKLDAKADPKVVRGVLSGALDSVSVTISFEWEQSHPNMKEGEFWQKLGETVDGKTVQLCVTKVTRLYELSVVWQGADQFAKTVDNEGNIKVPGVSNSLNLEDNIVNLKAIIAKFGLSLDPNTATEEQVSAALEEKLSTAETSLAEANTKLTETTAALAAQTTALDEAKASITALTVQVTDLTSQVTSLTAEAGLGKTYLGNQRSEALRLYNFVEGDKATEPMQTLIGNATLEVAQSFIASYQLRAEAMAPLHCSSCGCTKLSRKVTSTTPHTPDTPSLTADPRMETILQSMH